MRATVQPEPTAVDWRTVGQLRSDSPATPTQAFFQLLRRNTEGGPRIADLKHTSYRGVLGSRGDLSNVCSYDAYYQYGRTNYTQVYRNEFSIARLEGRSTS